MTERVRQPQDIRIVPAGTTGSGVRSPRSPSSSATAVQIFRLLASQARSVPLLSADTSDADTPPREEPDAQASHADDQACTSTVPDESHAPHEPPQAAAPGPSAHSEPGPDTSRSSALAGARSAGRRDAQRPEEPEHDIALGKQIVHACATAAHGDLFTRELAHRIARFCSMSGAQDDASWAVTLPMNPAVLPDTLLHLQLSPSSIGIRFETSNPRSTQLISDNADALRTRLSDTLGRRIDVDVA